MVRYFKLFALLASRGMKKTDLLKVISSPTLAKLSKGETVKTDVIERICHFLHCQPGDIMEVTRDEEMHSDGVFIEYTTEHPAVNNVPDIIARSVSTNPEFTDNSDSLYLGWNVDE